MVNGKRIYFLQISAILVIGFGVIGLGSTIYTYYQIAPKISELPAKLDSLYLEINSEMDQINRVMDEGEDVLYEFAEKADFSVLWWEPFEGIDEDIRYIAESLENLQNEINDRETDLQQAKNVILFQINQLNTLLKYTTMYSSLLHIIFILIGGSMLTIPGMISQTLSKEMEISEEEEEMNVETDNQEDDQSSKGTPVK
jgi:hypothetical protein